MQLTFHKQFIGYSYNNSQDVIMSRYYGDRNSTRLAAYHRLDIGFNRTKKEKDPLKRYHLELIMHITEKIHFRIFNI